MTEPTLCILPNIRARRVDEGTVALTQKFLDGVLEYDKFWPGSIQVLMQAIDHVDHNLDHVEVDTRDLPFDLDIVSFQSQELVEKLQNTSVVLVSIGYQAHHIAQLCASIERPSVFVTEYSLRTRKQIVDANTRNPLLRLRRKWWAMGEERLNRADIRASSGVQCNGTPTYKAYEPISRSPLLYFDSRIREEELARIEDVAHRMAGRDEASPLRLVFSGRLDAIKGADYLLLVAQALVQMDLPFELSICGDGELTGALKRQIAQKQLEPFVKLKGVLDFRTELVPFVKHETDLFVCCHIQGDPSCTYLETMSCGVPILGFANEAFEGVVEQSKTGWLVPMRKPLQMAKRIAEIGANRQELKKHSLAALEFARAHTFEKTFEKRIGHMCELAGL